MTISLRLTRINDSRLALVDLALVVLRIHEFRYDLSGMAARIIVVRVLGRFPFASLLPSVPGEYVLVVVVVEVLVFVKVLLGHSSLICCLCSRRKEAHVYYSSCLFAF